VSVKGAALAGPLPADMQNFSTYSAGLGAAARETAAARALIQFLSGPALGPTLKAKRIEKP
jgi:molybdate transport system substrate-binding protein